MKGVTFTAARVNVSANRWDFYTFGENKDASAKLAEDLNALLSEGFSAGLSRQELEAKAYALMTANRKLGATDSEPLWMLGCILGALYGEDEEQY